MIETRVAQIQPADVQVGDAAVLAANDLVYEISGVRLVNAVSLDLMPGDMVVVVGPNGAGKTTLLRLLGGVLKPTSGDVRLLGKPFADWSARERARLIASVPQHTNLDFDVAALDLVLLGRHPHPGRFQMECTPDFALA